MDPHRPLIRTIDHLLAHLEDCPSCQFNGLRYCLDVDGFLNAVKRARKVAVKTSAPR